MRANGLHRARLWGLLPLLVSSGCLGGSDASADDETALETGTGGGGPPGPNETFEEPVADFFATPNPARAGNAVSFDASNSLDPEGGNLTYAWEFGDGVTASGVSATHTFVSPGTFRAVLSVTSDVSGISGNASINLIVQDANADQGTLVLSDADDDGALDQTEILRVAIAVNGARLLVQVDLAEIDDSYALASAAMVNLVLNDTRFEVYGLNGETGVYNHAAGADVDGADVTLDDERNSMLVRLPLSQVGVAFPLQVHVETYVGASNASHGAVGDDRVPDEGEATYG